MIYPFEPRRGLVHVEAEITGPGGNRVVDLALDTGATTTLISEAILIRLGFDLADEASRIEMITGSAVTKVAQVVLTRTTALGRSLFGLPVLAHSLPPGTPIDGLLGLDFLRDSELTIDFKAGQIRLA